LTVELKRVLVVQAAMPSAVFTIVVARHYGGHAPTAVQVVLATTVASLLSAPLVLAWGFGGWGCEAQRAEGEEQREVLECSLLDAIELRA